MTRIHLLNLQRARPIPTRRAAALAARMLRRFGVRTGALSLVFVGTRRMRSLNRRYHHQDRVTDVLAFDLRSAVERHRRHLAGDVIIAPEVARRAAKRYGLTYTEELLTYVAHGMLHLLGYRDGTPRTRERMEQLQREFVHPQQQRRSN